MTVQPEMHFRCDRCSAEIRLPLNDQPSQDRAKPPEGWIALWVVESVIPANHLCGDCASEFKLFMMDKIN